MPERDKVTDYLSTATQRLRADGFSIIDNVTYKNQTFRCVAKRTRFQAEFFGFAEFFFIFKEFPEINENLLKEFSDVCYKYACRSKIIPFAYMPFDYAYCFPMALVGKLDMATAQAVRSEDPPRLFAGYEMPVIYNLGTKQLYYSEKNPLRGRLYHDYFRAMIISMLSP